MQPDQSVLPLWGSHTDADMKDNCLDAYVEGVLPYLHQQDSWAWVFVDGLRVKRATKSEDNNCHSDLFGWETVAYAPFRGWYQADKKTVTVMSRHTKLTSADQIPERVYRALTARWTPQRWIVL